MKYFYMQIFYDFLLSIYETATRSCLKVYGHLT